MTKPREFWVRTINGVQYAKNMPSKMIPYDVIHVREVVPIDWEKVFADIDPEWISLTEEEVTALKFEIKRLVEVPSVRAS